MPQLALPKIALGIALVADAERANCGTDSVD